MLYSFCAPVSHRYAPGDLQHEWWSRFELELKYSSALPSPVRIRLVDNIKSPEAKTIGPRSRQYFARFEQSRFRVQAWIILIVRVAFEGKCIHREIPIWLSRQPERISNRFKKSKRVMSP